MPVYLNTSYPSQIMNKKLHLIGEYMDNAYAYLYDDVYGRISIYWKNIYNHNRWLCLTEKFYFLQSRCCATGHSITGGMLGGKIVILAYGNSLVANVSLKCALEN